MLTSSVMGTTDRLEGWQSEGTGPHLLAPQCELAVVTRKKHKELLPAGFRITAPDRAEAGPEGAWDEGACGPPWDFTALSRVLRFSREA